MVDKHSSLLHKFVNYQQKKFYNIGSRGQVIKLFCPLCMNFHTKLEYLLVLAGKACQRQML
jgi:hypothetical protein